MEMETRAVYPVQLELRQEGNRPVIIGRFPYGEVATVSDRGRIRKETFEPRAFEFAVNDTTREINFLAGHSFNRPLASRRAGTLTLEDRADGLSFEAVLPPEGEQPTWMMDFLLARRAGLVGGISPGFNVPPATAVASAEVLTPEVGNPAVMVRRIRQAVLFEMSAVTRPAYDGTGLEERADNLIVPDRTLELYRWL